MGTWGFAVVRRFFGVGRSVDEGSGFVRSLSSWSEPLESECCWHVHGGKISVLEGCPAWMQRGPGYGGEG